MVIDPLKVDTHELVVPIFTTSLSNFIVEPFISLADDVPPILRVGFPEIIPPAKSVIKFGNTNGDVPLPPPESRRETLSTTTFAPNIFPEAETIPQFIVLFVNSTSLPK